MPMSIREFQFENLNNSNGIEKKKVIFIDKSFRQKTYTKRDLNRKFYQRSFRSLLVSTTGGKRETNDTSFNYSTLNNKVDFQITEIRNKIEEKIPDEPKVEEKTFESEDDDEDEDEGAMIISTDGDNEEQQKQFHKSKQKIIHSAPIIQERETTNQQETAPQGPGLILSIEDKVNLLSLSVPVVSRIKLAIPTQGNYEYCLWQLGTLQILIRSSFHGFCEHVQSEENVNREYLSCYTKLEYQPQFGFEQTTDREYRAIWCDSYLRHGANVLLGF